MAHPFRFRSADHKRFIIAAATLLLAFSVGSEANQSSPRLSRLFVQLQNATNATNAGHAESEIWAIWHETPDQKSLEIMRRARVALDSNDFDSAIEFLDELVDYAPDFAEAWNQRAIVHFLVEDYPGSLRDIQRALALEPRHFGALSGRGQVYMRLDEPELALEAFEAALALNPWLANVRRQIEMIRAYIGARQRPI